METSKKIPFVQGDGIGPDIWVAAKTVFDAAVAKAYDGQRSVEWIEVLAGELTRGDRIGRGSLAGLLRLRSRPLGYLDGDWLSLVCLTPHLKRDGRDGLRTGARGLQLVREDHLRRRLSVDDAELTGLAGADDGKSFQWGQLWMTWAAECPGERKEQG